MALILPEPDGYIEIDGHDVPVWECPNCGAQKVLEEFGERRREDAFPGQGISNKQSWCRSCRSNSR